MNESQPNREDSAKKIDRPAVNFFMLIPLSIEFAFYIGIPLGIFVWLRPKFHSQIYNILGVLVALAISAIMIGRKINEIRRTLK